MKKFQITYLMFNQSDLESSDIILYAKDEEDARRVFERQHPQWTFKNAKETT